MKVGATAIAVFLCSQSFGASYSHYGVFTHEFLVEGQQIYAFSGYCTESENWTHAVLLVVVDDSVDSNIWDYMPNIEGENDSRRFQIGDWKFECSGYPVLLYDTINGTTTTIHKDIRKLNPLNESTIKPVLEKLVASFLNDKRANQPVESNAG